MYFTYDVYESFQNQLQVLGLKIQRYGTSKMALQSLQVEKSHLTPALLPEQELKNELTDNNKLLNLIGKKIAFDESTAYLEDVAPVSIIDRGNGTSTIITFFDIVDMDASINIPPKENSLNFFSSDQERELFQVNAQFYFKLNLFSKVSYFQTIMIGLSPIITLLVGQIIDKIKDVFWVFLANRNLGPIAFGLQPEEFGIRQPDEEGQEMVPFNQNE